MLQKCANQLASPSFDTCIKASCLQLNSNTATPHQPEGHQYENRKLQIERR